MRPNAPRYATRLNAFKPRGGNILDWIGLAGTVGGLNAADLNYPDHFQGITPHELSAGLATAGMALNGLAMRFYTETAFNIGAFTHPDPDIRRAAIDLTKEGIDILTRMGGRIMTLWMGQDGFDYAFQMDYSNAWDGMVAALQEVADHNPDIMIALEYKPNDPRCFALLPDAGTSLLCVREAGKDNIGVTLDFAHALYADEMPAHAAHLIERHATLTGVHLNDGYAKRDDGLMIGTVHAVQIVELFVELGRSGYDGAIYFDTFPDVGGLDPVEEARTNLRIVERLCAIADSLAGHAELAQAIARRDAALSQRIVAASLFGA